MKGRSALRNYAEYIPAWLAVQSLRWAPRGIANALAGALADLVRVSVPRWRATAETNLKIAFPDWPAERSALATRRCYRNLAANLVALAKLPDLNTANISQWIRYEGFENYERAKAKGRGVIFLTAHLGVWELSSAAHALFGHPMSLMVRPLDNPLLDQLVDGRRRLFGNDPIRKQDAARDVLKVLRSGGDFGILADQNTAGADGVFVDFFGLPASSTKGVAQIAARTGAAIVPGFAVRAEGDSRYTLRFYEPLALRDTGDRAADLIENTQMCQSAIERAVRDYPDQWLWIHRRWKRRAEGQPAVY